MGYSSWQVSDDKGSETLNPGVHDSVHGIGVNAAIISVKRNVALSFHYMSEFSASDRFQGQSFSLNISFKLPGGAAK